MLIAKPFFVVSAHHGTNPVNRVERLKHPCDPVHLRTRARSAIAPAKLKKPMLVGNEVNFRHAVILNHKQLRG
jgi:hypothetical protein